MSVELDVRNYLTGPAFSRSGCSTSFTFVGPMRPGKTPFPLEAVVIQEYGGPQPHGFMDNRGQTYRKTDVQVRVRGTIGSYLATKTRADAIWSAMNRVSSGSISTASRQYVRIEPLQSGPNFIGEDDQECPEFTINVRLEHYTDFADTFRVYAGGSAVTIDTEAEVLALSAHDFRLDQSVSVAVTASSGQFAQIVYPATLDPVTFEVNGFVGGFISTASVVVGGVNYTVARSVVAGLGTITVDLT
jgi:hypothetical protein